MLSVGEILLVGIVDICVGTILETDGVAVAFIWRRTLLIPGSWFCDTNQLFKCTGRNSSPSLPDSTLCSMTVDISPDCSKSPHEITHDNSEPLAMSDFPDPGPATRTCRFRALLTNRLCSGRRRSAWKGFDR